MSLRTRRRSVTVVTINCGANLGRALKRYSLLCAAIYLLGSSVQAAPSLRYQTDQRGNVVVFGNSLAFDCATSVGGIGAVNPDVPSPTSGTIGSCGANTIDSAPDVFWRSDMPTSGQATGDITNSAATARSTATLTIPSNAVISYARLYWAAEAPSAATGPTAVLERVGGTSPFSSMVTADTASPITFNTQFFYQSSANVTAAVQAGGPGAYRVGNIVARDPSGISDNTYFAAWSMVVFYQLSTDPPRNLSIFDGMDIVSTASTPYSAILNGFLVPSGAGFDARLSLVAYEGDASIIGDTFSFKGNQLSNSLNPANNFFNFSHTFLGSPVSTLGDLPQANGQPASMTGVDIDTFDVTPYVVGGDTSAALAGTTTGDVYFLGVASIGISTYKPIFSDITKSFINLTEGGSNRPGDLLEYTITLSNTGSDTGSAVVLTDVLPVGVTYVPSSIQIVQGTNAGAKTDASGDDQADYVAASRTITVRLGTGANSSSGGTVTTSDTSHVIKFRATIAAAAGTLNNQASISCTGVKAASQGIGPVSFLSSTNGGAPTSPTPTVVDACASNTDCSGVSSSRCNTAVSPHACAGCLVDSDCSGSLSTPRCLTGSNTCVRCLATADCPSPATCNASNVCTLTAPTITAPTGTSSNSLPTVTGSAPANALVSIAVDGVAAGSTFATSAGAYSLRLNRILSVATHGIVATATEGNGAKAVSAISATDTYGVTGCTTAPNNCGASAPTCTVNGAACVSCTSTLQCTTNTPNTTCIAGACVVAVPVVTVPANGAVISSTTPTLSGSSPNSATVQIYVDGVSKGTTTASATGAWSLVSPSLSMGSHSVSAIATETGTSSITSANGNANSFTITAGCTSNAGCSGATPTCNTANNTCVGCLANADCSTAAPGSTCNTNTKVCYLPAAVVTTPTNNGYTHTLTPTYAGTASANRSVAIYVDSSLLATVIANGSGNWTYTTTTAITAANHTVYAVASTVGSYTVTAANSNTNSFTASAATTCQSDIECSGATPRCNVQTGACTICLSNADCSGGTPICDQIQMKCVRCDVDVDCTATAPGTTCTVASNTCALAAPVISSPTAGQVVNSTPTFTGTTAANAVVSFSLAGTSYGPTTASASGAYSFTPAVSLPYGSYSVTAQAISGSGATAVTSSASPATSFTLGCLSNADCAGSTPVCNTGAAVCVRCMVDGDCPTGATCGGGNSCSLAAPIILSPNPSQVLTSNLQVGGTAAANANVNISLDGSSYGPVRADAAGNWSLAPGAILLYGPHQVTALATAGAGVLLVTSPASAATAFVMGCLTNAACTGATPWCDVRSNVCTICTSDASCPAGNRCDLGTGICNSSCAQDSDCLSPYFCNQATCTAPVANGGALPSGAGTCTSGVGARICQSGACDSISNQCGYANGTACTADLQCDSGLCASDGHCGALGGAACTQAGSCRSGICGADGLCSLANGSACSTSGACRSVCPADGFCGLPNGSPCTASATCRSNVCSADGYCGLPPGASCSTGPACRSSSCSAGVCSLACQADGDCGSSHFCDPQHQRCASTAANRTACTAANACSSGICDGNGLCGSISGASCSGASSCQDGACSAGLCSSACAADGDCPAGDTCAASVCSPALAVGSACSRPGQCADGICYADGTCGTPTGQHCNTAVDCRSQICAFGVCSNNCGASADCLNAEYCAGGGICAAQQLNDASCTDAGQCLTAACSVVAASGACGHANGDACASDAICRSEVCYAADQRCGLPRQQRCAAAPQCRSFRCDAGLCAECGSDTDCPGSRCDLHSGTCGQPAAAAVYRIEGGGFGCANLGASGGAGLWTAAAIWAWRRWRNRGGACVPRLFLAWLVALGVLGGAGAAGAADHGFALNRYTPTPAGETTFWVDRPWYTDKHPHVAAGLTLDYGHRPLVYGISSGNSTHHTVAIIRHQLAGHLQVAASFWDRATFSASVPLLLLDRGTAAFGIAPIENVTFSDPKLGGMARVFGEALRDRLSLHVGGWVFIPLHKNSHAGDRMVRLMPKVVLAGVAFKHFVWSGTVAGLLRHTATVGSLPEQPGNTVGSELQLGGSWYYRDVRRRFSVGPEAVLATVLTSKHVFTRYYSSLEILLGGHYSPLPELQLGLAIGTGLLKEPGTPNFRGLLRAAWTPVMREAPAMAYVCPDVRVAGCPPDTDGDSVLDSIDLCPTEAQGATPDPTRLGCPLRDADGDGIPDARDLCPQEAAGPHPSSKRLGCPDLDSDGDGIFDEQDPCPSEAMGTFPDPARLGCPLDDRDHDQVPDGQDACPNDAGMPSVDPAKNGCPGLVRIEGSQIVTTEPVFFENGKDVILAKSFPMLESLTSVLKVRPEMKLAIEGHTDNKGNAGKNLVLSERRAASVMTFLVTHGVAQSRLQAHGFGDTRPKVGNASAASRAVNRRVDLRILP